MRLFFLWGVMLLGFAGLAPLQASETNRLSFHVLLVWGANDEKPSDPSLKEVDKELKERFKASLKWKHYYEVVRKPLVLTSESVQKLKLSDKCDIHVQKTGDCTAEIKLFGEGKHVQTVRQPFKPGELLVIGGDDKNDTSWMVVLIRSK